MRNYIIQIWSNILPYIYYWFYIQWLIIHSTGWWWCTINILILNVRNDLWNVTWINISNKKSDKKSRISAWWIQRALHTVIMSLLIGGFLFMFCCFRTQLNIHMTEITQQIKRKFIGSNKYFTALRLQQ